MSSQNAWRSDGSVAVSRHLEDERGAGGSPEAAPGDAPCRGPGRVDLAVQLAAPVGFLAAALILPAFIVASERPFRGVGLGPPAWPAAMPPFIPVCAQLGSAQALLAWRHGPLLPPP